MGFQDETGLWPLFIIRKRSSHFKHVFVIDIIPTHLTNQSSSLPLVAQEANESVGYFKFFVLIAF